MPKVDRQTAKAIVRAVMSGDSALGIATEEKTKVEKTLIKALIDGVPMPYTLKITVPIQMCKKCNEVFGSSLAEFKRYIQHYREKHMVPKNPSKIAFSFSMGGNHETFFSKKLIEDIWRFKCAQDEQTSFLTFCQLPVCRHSY